MTRAYLTVALGLMAAGYLLFQGCQAVAPYTDQWFMAMPSARAVAASPSSPYGSAPYRASIAIAGEAK